MAAPVSGILWLHCCRVWGSGDSSSIIKADPAWRRRAVNPAWTCFCTKTNMAANQLLMYAQSLVKSWLERREDWGEGRGRRKHEACWNKISVRATGSAFWSLVVRLRWMTAASLTCFYWLEDFFCWTDLAMTPHPPRCHGNISCPEAVNTRDRERRLKLRNPLLNQTADVLHVLITELKERSTVTEEMEVLPIQQKPFLRGIQNLSPIGSTDFNEFYWICFPAVGPNFSSTWCVDLWLYRFCDL